MLPLDTPPPQRLSPPPTAAFYAHYITAPFEQLLAAANAPTQPHTALGPSPGAAAAEAAALPPFLPSVQAALGDCFAATRALYAAEGIPLPGAPGAHPPGSPEEGLPQPLLAWAAEAGKRAGDLRDFSARRLRSACCRAEALLARAPAAVVGAVLARAVAGARASALGLVGAYRARAGGLEGERREHTAALRLALGDPNAAHSLAELCSAEAARSAALKAAMAEARASMLEARRAAAARAAAALAHSAALTCLLCQEVLAPWDLAPLPGDEYLPPAKMSFKRLHKTLRRAGGEAAALAAAVLGDEEAVEEGQTAPVEGAGSAALLEHQKAGGAGAGEAAAGGSKPAPKAAAAAAAAGKDKKAGGSAAAAAPPEPAHKPVPRGARDYLAQFSWPGLSPHPSVAFSLHTAAEASSSSSPSPAAASAPFGAVQCFLGPASRHAIAARDAAYAAVCREHSEACSEIVARFELAEAEAERWDRVWQARVASLTAEEGLRGAGLAVPSFPELLPLPSPPPQPVLAAAAVQPVPAAAGKKK